MVVSWGGSLIGIFNSVVSSSRSSVRDFVLLFPFNYFPFLLMVIDSIKQGGAAGIHYGDQ